MYFSFGELQYTIYCTLSAVLDVANSSAVVHFSLRGRQKNALLNLAKVISLDCD